MNTDAKVDCSNEEQNEALEATAPASERLCLKVGLADPDEADRGGQVGDEQEDEDGDEPDGSEGHGQEGHLESSRELSVFLRRVL